MLQDYMPKKTYDRTIIDSDWFLIQWMRTLGLTQAELLRRTGWSKARTNDIYHGRTDFYRAILNEAALAMNIKPYELLMYPDEAMALRRLRDTAVSIAAETPQNFMGLPSTNQAADEVGAEKNRISENIKRIQS